MNKFCSLVSSSRGNAVLASDGKTNILIDCGISRIKTVSALSKAEVCGQDIDAILVTHEHSDHIGGVGVMSRGFNIPVYANDKTWAAMESSLGKIAPENVRVINTGEEFEIKTIRAKSFSTPHDASDSVGYKLELDGISAAVATDMGCIDKKVAEQLSGTDVVLLEANHDVEMLKKGSYPPALKQRILSDYGHLSNELSAEMAVRLLKGGTRAILLGHLSEENNLADIAYGVVKKALSDAGAKIDSDIRLAVANRYEVSGMF